MQPGQSSYSTSRKSGMVLASNTRRLKFRPPPADKKLQILANLQRRRVRRYLFVQVRPQAGREESEIESSESSGGRLAYPALSRARQNLASNSRSISVSDSGSGGVLKGHTVDISESGISAMLRIEVPLGEIVELGFTLPFGPRELFMRWFAREDAFRYGFQFIGVKLPRKKSFGPPAASLPWNRPFGEL